MAGDRHTGGHRCSEAGGQVDRRLLQVHSKLSRVDGIAAKINSPTVRFPDCGHAALNFVSMQPDAARRTLGRNLTLTPARGQ